jgi:hypothetical protein
LYEQLYQNDTTFIVPSKLRDKKERGNLFNFSLGKRKQDLQDAATKKKQKGGDSRVCTCFEVNFLSNKKRTRLPSKFSSKDTLITRVLLSLHQYLVRICQHFQFRRP